MRPTIFLSALAPLLLSLPAAAQDDHVAGLFTKAKQLPIVEQSLLVDVAGAEARVKLVQVFANGGGDLAQADYRLELPRQAQVVSFGFWQGDRFLSSSLKEKGEAKAAHARAASEGRATGLLEKKRNIRSFSVYPVGAGERKRVETELRLPVVVEMGRSHVRLPVDVFLGQAPLASSVLVRVRADEALVDLGADGVRTHVLGRGAREGTVAFSTSRGVDVWWKEDGPPLLVRAEQVTLHEAEKGVGLKVALNDASQWAQPFDELHVVVDGSFSMRRHRASLRDALARLSALAPAKPHVYAVARRVDELPADASPSALAARALDGSVGHDASFARLEKVLSGLPCDAARARCVLITDATLDGVHKAVRGEVPALVFATPSELAFQAEALADAPRVFQPGVDSDAALRSSVDELVLPTLELLAVEAGGVAVPFLGKGNRRVPEGGMVRLFSDKPLEGPLTVVATLRGESIERVVPLLAVEAESAVGKALRRDVYSARLRAWMKEYGEGRDHALRQRIVDVSVREGIPTAFTSLHVEDPRLSLYAIKPGDPLLSVPAEAGLVDVLVYYPFGESRRLVRDAASGRFLDRFLVPRHWEERAYRVDVFKRYQDGSVKKTAAWYRLDERGPTASIRLDEERAMLVVDTSGRTGDVGAISVHSHDGRVLPLAPVGDEWRIAAAELPGSFVIWVRDRAGNRTRFDATFLRGVLDVSTARAPRTAAADGGAGRFEVLPITFAHASGARVVGEHVEMATPAGALRFRQAEARLRSLERTAFADLGRGRYLLGTRAGDLVRLSCKKGGSCRARRLETQFDDHPIVGLVHFGGGRVLAGVLGKGLYDVAGERIKRSRWKVGSRYITGLQPVGPSVLVGTAYNGLWRIRRGRATKTHFPHDHVARVFDDGGDIVVDSFQGRYLRAGVDRFVAAGEPTGVTPFSERVMAGGRFAGRVFLASFDRGLLERGASGLAPVDLGLRGEALHANAIATGGDILWLATQAGLYRVTESGRGRGLEAMRVIDGAVTSVAVEGADVAAAGAGGVFVRRSDGRFVRIDEQSGAQVRGLAAVTFHGGAIWAGGLEGLYRFDGWQGARDGRAPARGQQLGSGAGFDAGWVTALLDEGDRLLVGTYDEGVWFVSGARAWAASGLEGQWVPFGGLARVGDSVWIGGLGMAPARWHDAACGGRGVYVESLAVPAADVFGFVADDDALLVLTNDGVAEAALPDGAHLSASR
jgi:hypothetical protein